LELIDLASDWRGVEALERTDTAQVLVEFIFYDPFAQSIGGVLFVNVPRGARLNLGQ